MASKSKRRGRVFRASCILAALIIAGSSFAWFTSKDEVTNRLTATADYGVSIVEDFYPPQDMTPGQKVNKDVSAVNTGNVDALVRLALESEFDYSKQKSTKLTVAKDKVHETYSNASGETEDTSDANWENTYAITATAGAQTAPANYPNYLYSTYTFGVTAPAATAPDVLVELDPREKIDSNGNRIANEVTTVQAGGTLVVKANKSVAPTNEFPVRSGDDTNSDTDIEIIYQMATGTVGYTDGAGDAQTTPYFYHDGTNWKAVVKNADGTYTDTGYGLTTAPNATQLQNAKVIGVTQDYSGVLQFKPAEEGLYIFRRSADITGTSTSATDDSNPTYSGYYFKPDNVNGDKFYALETLTTASGVKTAQLKSATDTQSDVVKTDAKGIVNDINVNFLYKENGITLAKDGTSVEYAFEQVAYDSATGAVTTTPVGSETAYNAVKVTVKSAAGDTKPVIFHILLAEDFDKNTKKSNNWTYVSGVSAATTPSSTNGFGYFYYNEPLDAGETSAKLVDAVILDSSMTAENYLDMVYDLNVILDSIQITKDEYNNEVATQADGWATPTATNKTNTTPTEIDSIAWA